MDGLFRGGAVTSTNEQRDVVILGGGLAGLTLSRQLLLETDKRILMLERRDEIPWFHQKVGESSVQLAGHYFGKVLDLERYLLHEHFMKYNLRFYFRSGARENGRFEDYGHVSIRSFSNVPSYQFNRNTLEAELLRLNQESDRFSVVTGIRNLDVEIDPEGPHQIRYRAGAEARSVEASWLVDASGRNRFLARKLKLQRPMPIHNNTFFWWVEGTVDIEKLTDRSPRSVRLKSERSALGHLPVFLATNHFCAEGLWFWVIPLQGKTSLGLVYDSRVIRHEDINSVEKATRWVSEKFPLFARDLPTRKVLDFGTIRGFSHDCERTISPARWAMTGEAGRFTDPLYSPGSDLIATYNTMIVNAIAIDDPVERGAMIETYEQMMRALAGAYIPSYVVSYDCLGDQEAFSLKYSWELSVYFVAYVFPFINDLFGDRRFLIAFMRFFGRLGPINQALHKLLSAFLQLEEAEWDPRAGGRADLLRPDGDRDHARGREVLLPCRPRLGRGSRSAGRPARPPRGAGAFHRGARGFGRRRGRAGVVEPRLRRRYRAAWPRLVSRRAAAALAGGGGQSRTLGVVFRPPRDAPLPPGATGEPGEAPGGRGREVTT